MCTKQKYLTRIGFLYMIYCTLFLGLVFSDHFSIISTFTPPPPPHGEKHIFFSSRVSRISCSKFRRELIVSDGDYTNTI